MKAVIVDAYTDEPAGLGVPPYLGTYPRYIAGLLMSKGYDVVYLTVDDLRLQSKYNGKIPSTKESQKTDIAVYNLTKNNVSQILNADELVIIAGMHTPGKYLSAYPATLKEIVRLTAGYKCKKIITGPAVFGSATFGGRVREEIDLSDYSVKCLEFNYSSLEKYAVDGASVIKQIPDVRVIEIETGKGCGGRCSFCTEPLKNKIAFRKHESIIAEMKAFYQLGVRHFRLGKQTCFYALPKADELLEKINDEMPDMEVLHIDNVNPNAVITERGKKITKAIVKYCTEGNIAAFGVESFDPVVQEKNNLNCSADVAFEAVKVINEFGSERGPNGMPKYLPGINLMFGLIGESKKTNEHNMEWLNKILDAGLMLRRINVRQVNIFENTPLFEVGSKYLKKNKKYYWKWRNEIRQKIDAEMLDRVVPIGTVLKNVRMEIYDGKKTFGRQLGTYPLIVGVEERVELKKFYNIRVKKHMLRSLVGEVV